EDVGQFVVRDVGANAPIRPLTFAGERKGTYWGIRTNIADYKLPDVFDYPHEKSLAIADTPTRLKRLEPNEQEAIMNWGYAVCDAAMRKHVLPGLAKPSQLPFPTN